MWLLKVGVCPNNRKRRTDNTSVGILNMPIRENEIDIELPTPIEDFLVTKSEEEGGPFGRNRVMDTKFRFRLF